MKCRYRRPDKRTMYTTECGVEAVHRADCGDWTYCPYCGDKIIYNEDDDRLFKWELEEYWSEETLDH